MAVDTPARIAVLGAGPIGLEAALYARFLGYDVDIYEQGEVAENVRMSPPADVSALYGAEPLASGTSRCRRRRQSVRTPRDEALLTGGEWRERYLLPLADTDLLSDHLHLRTTVAAVGREGVRKGDLLRDDDRGDYAFRLLRSAEGVESIRQADVVLDATGLFATPNWCGQGGVPASAKRRFANELPTTCPTWRVPIEGSTPAATRSWWEAAARRRRRSSNWLDWPKRRRARTITWITRRPAWSDDAGPVPLVVDDPLPERRRLVEAANALARSGAGPIEHVADTVVHSIAYDASSDQFLTELLGERAGPLIRSDRGERRLSA